MRTIILQAAIKILMPVFFMYSIYLLFTGHHSPGGGFIAALVMAIGLIFHVIAFGVKHTQETYRINTIVLTGLGLLLSLGAGILPLFQRSLAFKALWTDIEIPFLGTLGTVLLFDVGVYLAVLGAILKISFTIFEE